MLLYLWLYKSEFLSYNLSVGGIRFRRALFYDGERVRKGDFTVYKGKITFIDVPVEREIDVDGYLFLPGLINAHHHTYSALARGVPFSRKLRNFYENLSYFWWRWDASLDEESVYYSALLGAMESLKKGVTLIFDHHASFSFIEGSLSVLKKAFTLVGIRSVVCFEVSDRLGSENAHRSIEENLRFIKSEEESLIKGVVGMHAAFTVGNKTMEALSSVVSKTKRPVHVHVAEDRFDRDYNLSVFGKTPLQRLRDYAILDGGLLAHVIWVDEDDIELIRKHNAYVLHNPESNMNNAVGYFKVSDLVRKNVRVLLGTDGFSHSVLTQARSAVLNATARGYDGWSIFYKSLFHNNYELAARFFDEKFGKIAEGYVADIAGFKYTPPTPLDGDNLFTHMFFEFAEREADFVMVNGIPVIEHGRFVNIDEREISLRAQEVARRLWRRFENNKLEFKLPYE